MQARSPYGAMALLLACACGSFTAACDEPEANREDAGDEEEQDASGDGGARPDGGGGSNGGSNEDGGAGSDSGQDASTGGGDASGTDGGTNGGPSDPLAPFALDCANLPSNGVCQGGPREVLLVAEETGLIAMFDPTDGHFLGYFKRPAASYYAAGTAEYNYATQGPDQCIWTASEEAGIERWNTDGTFRDLPLQPHFLPVNGSPDEEALQGPITFAFTADKLYVNSTSGYPNHRVLAWNLNGTFDKIVLEDEMTVQSLLVLGDGSLLLADDDRNRVVRIPAAGGTPVPVLGEINWPGQISYAGGNKLLVADITLGGPVYEVEIETMIARQINPQVESSSNKHGLAPLRNGKWLLTGGQFYVSTLDPASTNPSGQNARVWEDSAVDGVNFKYVGRACLPTALVESRASKPANDTCIDPPDGPTLFAEDFEGTDVFSGSGEQRHYKAFYDRGAAGVTTSVGAGPAAGMAENNTRTLQIAGAGELPGSDGRPQVVKTGMVANFTGGQPKYISYRVFVADASQQSLGFLVLENAAANTYEYAYLAGTYVFNGYFRGVNSNAASEENNNEARWLRIELRNIDWTTRTYDLYLDCKRIAEGIGLPAGLGDSIDRVDLYNYAENPDATTVAWYDDILIK